MLFRSPNAKPAATDSDDTPAPAATPAPVAEEEDEAPTPTAPVEAAKPASQKAEDILAMIRARQQK